ncbi:hypothetical protein KKG41_01880 [Patescibacteria group bacterium]|nr:hypothetical protein [Patescibacteria group bacterium]MBU1890370.1 hypothetical protein [Patescibacteria group bacterium]
MITPDVRMTLVLSLTKINDGEWLREQQAAEKSIGEIIAAAHADLDLLSEQPYEKRMATMGDLICGGDLSAQPLVIGFGHEPEVSFWMLEQGLLKPDEVGLEPCECYAVFLDDSGTIIHVDKFMPTLQGPGSDPTGQATAQRIVVE